MIYKYTVLPVLALIFLLSNASAANRLILFDLKDDSTYRGKWDLAAEMSTMLSAVLATEKGIKVIRKERSTLDQVKGSRADLSDLKGLKELAAAHNANIVLVGSINKFNIIKSGVVSPAIGGWESYVANCEIKYQLIDIRSGEGGFHTASGRESSHSLGLTILGGPGGMSEEGSLMDKMESLKFGSPYFNKTLLGTSVNSSLHKVLSNIMTLFPVELSDVNGKVVDVDDEYVYLNLGFDDNLLEGQEFIIYSRGREVIDPDSGKSLGFRERDIALVRIDRVINPEFSRAVIVKTYKKAKVAPGQLAKFKRK